MTENLGNFLLNLLVLFFLDLGILTKSQSSNFTQQILGEQTSQQLSIQEPATQNDSTQFTTAKVTRIVDGDTIEIEGGQKVRYIGINTPESKDPRKPVECFSAQATQKNTELVADKIIQLEKDVSDTDRYGRLLRYVYVDGRMVNEILVKEGFAQASAYPPDIKYQDLFVQTQQQAQLQKLGLWGETCLQASPTPTLVPTKIPRPTATRIPTPKLTLTTTSKTTAPAAPAISAYTCNCAKTCPQMSSCDEAYYQLNVCECKVRDGDHDGVPCESICPGG